MNPRGGGRWGLSATARRTSPLPGGWKLIRATVLDRDGHQCTWTEADTRCPNTTGLEVDHIGDPEDHSLDNLRVLCTRHHASKTGRDASLTRWTRRRQAPKPRHPGLVA